MRKKALLTSIAVLVLLVVLVSPAFAAEFYAVSDFERYTEPEGDFHWAMNDLKLAVAAELFRGYPPEKPEALFWWWDTGTVICKVLGELRPDAAISRAEYATIVARALDLEGRRYSSSPFSDVKPSDWFGPNVLRLTQERIIDPVDYGSRFGPKEPITRQEIAVWMVRAAERVGIKAKPADVSFRDFDARSRQASYVAKAVGLGILKGYPDGTFRSNAGANRAESAVMLVRLLKHLPLFDGLNKENTKTAIQRVFDAGEKCRKSWRVNVNAGHERNKQFEAALKVFQEETKDVLTDYNREPRMHPQGLGVLNKIIERDEVGPWCDWASLRDVGFGFVDGLLVRRGSDRIGMPAEYTFARVVSIDKLVGCGPVAEVQFTSWGGTKYIDGNILGGEKNVCDGGRALLVKQGGKWKVAALYMDGRGPWLKLIGFAR